MLILWLLLITIAKSGGEPRTVCYDTRYEVSGRQRGFLILWKFGQPKFHELGELTPSKSYGDWAGWATVRATRATGHLQGGDMSKPPKISFLRPQLVTLWKRLTLRLSKMSVITVFTKMHCQRLVLDQVEQFGGEVGNDHVGSSSSHASCNLYNWVVIKPRTKQSLKILRPNSAKCKVTSSRVVSRLKAPAAAPWWIIAYSPDTC